MKGLCLLCALAITLGARQETLFRIERSTNANIVVYEANVMASGQLDPKRPVASYWKMLAEDGRRQELNALERKAYGAMTGAIRADQSLAMWLAAAKDREILIRAADGTMRAEVTIDGRRAWLRRVYVTTRRSWPVNDVVSVELFGEDIASGQPVHEKILRSR